MHRDRGASAPSACIRGRFFPPLSIAAKITIRMKWRAREREREIDESLNYYERVISSDGYKNKRTSSLAIPEIERRKSRINNPFDLRPIKFRMPAATLALPTDPMYRVYCFE